LKLSYDWLSDYVDLSGLTPEVVAEKLTMGAFEVEELKRVGPDIQGDVVVGEILDIRRHPDAEKIRLTTIRISENEEPRQIVCGAWNIEVGQRIPVALPGAKGSIAWTARRWPLKRARFAANFPAACFAPRLSLVSPAVARAFSSWIPPRRSAPMPRNCSAFRTRSSMWAPDRTVAMRFAFWVWLAK
jgi:tRNA-binding EMAP/Myf-like protein